MKQFLKVIVTVKFIVEAAAELVAGLIHIRAAIVPPAVEQPETGAFPALLPRVLGAFKPFASEFHPLAATVGLQMPSRIFPFRSRRALTVSTNWSPRGSFAGGMTNRRFAVRTG